MTEVYRVSVDLAGDLLMAKRVLSVDAVRRIRSLYTGQRGEVSRFGREYGVSRSSIRKIVEGRTWKGIGAHDYGTEGVTSRLPEEGERL